MPLGPEQAPLTLTVSAEVMNVPEAWGTAMVTVGLVKSYGSSGDRVGENIDRTGFLTRVAKGFRDFGSPQILVRFRDGQIKQA